MRKVEDGKRQEYSKRNEPSKPILYIDRYFKVPAAKIGPGEFYTTQRNMVIVTVLGSCVSACLRDPAVNVGGMNHFMLPYRTTESDTPVSESARYGAYAMEVLVNHLLAMGAKRERLEAKVFGAGRVIPGMQDIGERNAKFALEYLKRENIRVVAQDLGSNEASKVYFFPHTGRVLVKRLRILQNDTVIVRERDYAEILETFTKAKPAEIFA